MGFYWTHCSKKINIFHFEIYVHMHIYQVHLFIVVNYVALALEFLPFIYHSFLYTAPFPVGKYYRFPGFPKFFLAV